MYLAWMQIINILQYGRRGYNLKFLKRSLMLSGLRRLSLLQMLFFSSILILSKWLRDLCAEKSGNNIHENKSHTYLIELSLPNMSVGTKALGNMFNPL